MQPNKLILCVEDDEDDCTWIEEAAHNFDPSIRVVFKPNGQEGLDFLREQQQKKDLPCLVLMDVNMPVLNGRETLRQIKEDSQLNEVAVVMFTTSNNNMDRLYFATKGVEMATKPDRMEDFRLLIEKLIAKYCG